MGHQCVDHIIIGWVSSLVFFFFRFLMFLSFNGVENCRHEYVKMFALDTLIRLLTSENHTYARTAKTSIRYHLRDIDEQLKLSTAQSTYNRICSHNFTMSCKTFVVAFFFVSFVLHPPIVFRLLGQFRFKWSTAIAWSQLDWWVDEGEFMSVERRQQRIGKGENDKHKERIEYHISESDDTRPKKNQPFTHFAAAATAAAAAEC